MVILFSFFPRLSDVKHKGGMCYINLQLSDLAGNNVDQLPP